ncbi:MAG TPA: DUF928 domain-containing protein [Tepidisphaeraceae bacterium]|jgi:hypothetical protein
MANTNIPIRALMAVVLMIFPLHSLAQPTDSTAAPSSEIVYQAPPHSHGNTRVEAAATNRGPENNLPSLYILAPDHVSWTIQEQPVLFWYLSKPAAHTPLVLTLMVADDTKDDDQVLNVKLDASRSGIQPLELAKYHIKLKLGVDYQISLALKPVKNKGSEDIVCSAEIMRVSPPRELVAQMLATSDPLEKTKLLAKKGMFYDALAMLCHEIDKGSQDRIWRERRASLLQQVELPEVALFDRSLLPEVHSSLDRD